MATPLDELTVEHLFALYRTTGRPRYLAEVFDRTAPDLLRLAAHLAHDPAQAEDLVQATFLSVIRSARRFDASRRFLPWLNGILSNVARDARRKAARGARRPEEENPEPAAEDGDPAELAAGAELDERAEHAIEGLDEPYRTVLILSARHGLAPGEIARIVRHSPATVRSQLARGRDRLRERLPAGLGALAVLPFDSGRGLAAVRRAVVGRAALWAPVIVAGTALSLVTAHKVAAAVLMLATGLAIGRLATERAGAEPRPEAGPTDRGPASVEPRAPGSAGAALVRERASLTEVVPSPDARLHVRVVHEGEPQAGVLVRVRGVHASEPLLDELGTGTGFDGVATFSVPAGALRILLDRARGPELALVAGEDRRVDVELGSGRDLVARVVDARGEPLAGASIWLAERGLADLGAVVGHTDASGRFALRGVGPEFLVAAFAPRHAPCGPVPIGEETVTLVLREPAARVQGRVVDDEGAPIAHALVRFGVEGAPFQLFDTEGDQRFVSNPVVVAVRTDPDGWYQLEHVQPGRRVAFVRAAGFVGERRVVRVECDGPVRHDFVLARGGVLEGLVTDGGRPVEGCRVDLASTELGAPGWFRPAVRTDAAGTFRLTGLAPGVLGVSLDTGGGGSLRRTVDLERVERAFLSVDLAEVPAIEGRVVDAHGRPRPGLPIVFGDADSPGATSDAAGRFRWIPLGDGPFDARVLDPAALVPRAVARATNARTGDDLTLVVREEDLATAHLVGAVVVEDPTVAGELGLRIRCSEVPFWTSLEVEDELGRFEVGPLVPGDYELAAFAPEHASIPVEVRALRAGEERRLGPLTLGVGGRIEWDVIREGERVEERLSVAVWEAGPGGRLLFQRDLVEGERTTPWLPPGPVRVAVWGTRAPIVFGELAVVAGQSTDLELDCPQAFACRVVLDEALAGPPAGPRTVAVRWFQDGIEVAQDHWFFPPGAAPAFERPLVPGRYSLRVQAQDGARGEAELEISSRAHEVTVERVD